MSTVIAFVNQKGGVGKTTLAIHAAWDLVRTGGNVLLMDADPQGSAADWASLRAATPFATVACARSDLDAEVERLRATYPWIVIDGPPRQSDIARACLVVADLVVVPVEPSVLSVYAAEDTFAQFRDAEPFRPPHAIMCQVINRKIPNTILGREWRTVAQPANDSAVAASPPRVLQAEITMRVDFARAVNQGQVVQESAPGSPAAAELRALGDELIDICTGLAA